MHKGAEVLTPDPSRSVGEVLAEAYARADWTSVRALIEQARHMRNLPDDLRDALAKIMTPFVAGYRGDEDLFVDHALAVIADVADDEVFDVELFRRHYDAGKADPSPSSALPPLFEAVVETARRLRDAWCLEDALGGGGTSAVFCGSASYGPFYNVRSGSDLDFVFVIPDASAAPVVVDRIGALEGVDPASIKRLRARAELFRDSYYDGRTVLSHKVDMWTDRCDPLLEKAGRSREYRLSLHLITTDVLRYVLVETSQALDREKAGGRRTVRDYRDTPTSRPDIQRTFGGREYRIEPALQAVELGWLRPTTVYQFDDFGCYCPGFLQTILLPLLDLRWDELGIQSRLQSFKHKFFSRYRAERARAPHAHLLPSYTHLRREVFAPHVVRDFDQDR